MKRPVMVLMLCLLAGLLAWMELRQEKKRRPESGVLSVEEGVQAGFRSETTEPGAVKNVPMEPVNTSPALSPSAQPAVVALAPGGSAAGESTTDPRVKRAYMLSLDKGALALIEAQDIEGDFAPKRRKEEEWSGMLRCKLLSETNDVLAEELLPAPDHLCVVIDPKSGLDKPVQYTVAGPVVFQVRMPRVNGASRLDIYRIIQPGEQPLEGLLGSIVLPRS